MCLILPVGSRGHTDARCNPPTAIYPRRQRDGLPYGSECRAWSRYETCRWYSRDPRKRPPARRDGNTSEIAPTRVAHGFSRGGHHHVAQASCLQHLAQCTEQRCSPDMAWDNARRCGRSRTSTVPYTRRRCSIHADNAIRHLRGCPIHSGVCRSAVATPPPRRNGWGTDENPKNTPPPQSIPHPSPETWRAYRNRV